MRINSDNVSAAFLALMVAGFNQPAAWSRLDPSSIAATWAGMLADVPPDALEASVLAYIRSGAEFWPRPGQLLNLARQVARGPALDLREEFRWLVDAAHSAGDRARFESALARRYPEGPPRQLSCSLTAFGGFHGLISTHHTRDSQGLRDFHFRLKDFQAAYDGAGQSIEDAKVLRLVDRASRRIEG